MNEEEKLQAKIEHTKRFQEIKDIINKEEYDLLILDEIIATINNEFIELNDVIEFLRNKPKSLEVVMTGRDPKDELVELSNYVTEMKCIKHPFKEGIPSRVGIELQGLVNLIYLIYNTICAIKIKFYFLNTFNKKDKIKRSNI